MSPPAWTDRIQALRETLGSGVSRVWGWVRPVAFWGGFAFMGLTILRTALAEPPTTPRPADVENAARIVESETGEDLRLQRPEGRWIGGLGIIEPATPERQLGPATPGRIAMVAVREGTFVEAGTVLVELESVAEQAALAAAEAEVRSAEYELERVQGAARTEDLAALQRDADAARVRAATSKATYDRLAATVSAGGVTTDELERAQRQAEQDQLAAEAAASRKRSAERNRPLDARLARARLDAAVARRDQAQAAVQLRQVVAPIDGEVLEVLSEVGEYVTPGGVEPVVVLGDTRTLKARIDVDERDVDAIREGGRAIVTVDALPGRQFEGQVIAIANRMGRKNVRSDEPTERIDTKILEVVVELGEQDALIVGQRVMGYLEPS